MSALTNDLKAKAESLIYRMQKEASRESWVDFLEYQGVSDEEADQIFKAIADSLELDGSQFYFKV